MWPAPSDGVVHARMVRACQFGADALGCRYGKDLAVWGWEGRTLSGSVTGPGEAAWLRVACTPADNYRHIFWTGTVSAADIIPPSVPPPPPARPARVARRALALALPRRTLRARLRGERRDRRHRPDTARLPDAWWDQVRAPAGYDAATLHTYCLLAPQASAAVRMNLRHLLDSPAERGFAELVVITEALHAASCGVHVAIAPALRDRARVLLGRDVPP
jgi:hypothetical protein